MYYGLSSLSVSNHVELRVPCEVAELKLDKIPPLPLIMMILPIQWVRERERERERKKKKMIMMVKKKMKPKMGFIFQINEYGFGTQLHQEKRQKGRT